MSPCDFGGKDYSYAYRTVRLRGRVMYAHRAAWELAHGPIPDGMIVRHMCGNKACANAEHLRIGTHKDNAQDRESAGRNVCVSFGGHYA